MSIYNEKEIACWSSLTSPEIQTFRNKRQQNDISHFLPICGS